MKFSRALPWILLVILVVGFGAYIGTQRVPTPTPTIQTATSQTTPAIQKVDFMMSFIAEGEFTPYYVAVDQGFFAKQGLQVNLLPNPQGSAGAIRALAGKRVEFASADVGTLVALMSKENITNVRAIALRYTKSPMEVIYLTGKGNSTIKTPKDLEGRTLGSFVGNSVNYMFPVFCKANGIDCGKVKIQYASGATLNSGLLSGSFDGLLLYSRNIATLQPEAAKQGLKVGNFSFASHGVDVYGEVILTRTDLIAGNPDLVKRFLQGFEGAVQFSVANPEDAVRSILKFNPQLNANVTLAEWKIAAPLMGGKAILNAKDPLTIAWIDPSKMARTITIVSVAYGVPAPNSSEVYTDQFVKSP